MTGIRSVGTSQVGNATAVAQVRNFKSLTGLRFYAALLVVVSHFAHEYFPAAPARDFFYTGTVGVSFFFILSGFVLTWSMHPGRSPRTFYRNRFARVYPLHAITWVAMGLILLGRGDGPGWSIALAALLLVQAWVPDDSYYFGMNGPSWSLSCEAFFYAVFPWLGPRIARVSSRRLVTLACLLYLFVGLLTLVAHVLLQDGPTVALLYVNPGYRLWEFLIGIALATVLRDGWRCPVGTTVAATSTVVVLVALSLLDVGITYGYGPLERLPMDGLPSDLASLAMVPFFVLLIAASATSEAAGGRSHLSSPILVRLGQWSFALYLLNVLVTELLGEVLIDNVLGWLPAVALSVGALALCIAVSGLCYRLIEMPIERRLRSQAVPNRMD